MSHSTGARLTPGTLLVAAPLEPDDGLFARSVILLVDCEPNGITTGLALNRPLDHTALESSALALLFLTDLTACAFWGGPMGQDPAILAQLTRTDGLEWFHLPRQQRRPFPTPDVGLIAVAEHPEPFADRVVRARLFVGLSVWGSGGAEREVARGAWHVAQATADDIFTPTPERLWVDALARAQ